MSDFPHPTYWLQEKLITLVSSPPTSTCFRPGAAENTSNLSETERSTAWHERVWFHGSEYVARFCVHPIRTDLNKRVKEELKLFPSADLIAFLHSNSSHTLHTRRFRVKLVLLVRCLQSWLGLYSIDLHRLIYYSNISSHLYYLLHVINIQNVP
jgi:hypothetical protein